ncbi:hypothetical protein ASD54_12445 [Rhizobium sp. Root149]|uniref:hypothetical protein n=1 Tax=Rhizobium sp. Root149 TaxID=1736473 RepID=UPI000715B975|nr:hypothetical protein [Rhizobium sp. Root149]KQZ49741.1 hypothetical protein ASD54_12445 [Rhizobium sp. Root149]
MSKWNLQKDIYLVAYHEIGADFVAQHDLGFKTKGAGEKRVKELKRTGVWEKIEAYLAAQTVMQSWHTLTFSRHEEAREIALNELETRNLPVPEWLKEQLEKAA